MPTGAVRLYNTMTQRVEPLEPLEPGHVRLYVCGLTTYDHAHAGHARTFVAFDVLVRFLRARGLPRHVRAQRHRRRRQDPQARRSSAEKRRSSSRGACPLVNADELRACGCLDTGRRAARERDHRPEIVALIEQLVAKGDCVRGGDRQGAATSTSPSARSRVTASSRTATSTTSSPARASSPARRSAIRSTSPSGRRATSRRPRLGEPVGQGAARLAHRVLGDGGGDAVAALRHPRRRHGPRLSAPRERDRAERGRVGRALRAPLAPLGVPQRSTPRR